MSDQQHPFLRRRDGHHARITYEELFFDLVYVFAVTQSAIRQLIMASAIPDAFGQRGLIFAAGYVGIQVGRTNDHGRDVGGLHLGRQMPN